MVNWAGIGLASDTRISVLKLTTKIYKIISILNYK